MFSDELLKTLAEDGGLARFSLKYTTYFPMGIYVYGSIYSRSSTLARRDSIQFPYAPLQDEPLVVQFHCVIK